MRSNPKGLHFERWRHIHGCGRWFNLARDTVSDRILAVYPMGEPRPKIDRRPRRAEAGPADSRRRPAPTTRHEQRRRQPAASPAGGGRIDRRRPLGFTFDGAR